MSKKFDKSEQSAATPWGLSQESVEIMNGIVRYSTASHGGYFLMKAQNKQVPHYFKAITYMQLGKQGWYEEDEDWAIVAVVFPSCFHKDQLGRAQQILKRRQPKLWLKFQKSHPVG